MTLTNVCPQFIPEPDEVWWGRVAAEAIATGRDVPKSWDISYDSGADGCMPAGWYAIALDDRGMPVDWPVRHEYGPFRTGCSARAYANQVDRFYASKQRTTKTQSIWI